jgi:hypothetical protein
MCPSYLKEQLLHNALIISKPTTKVINYFINKGATLTAASNSSLIKINECMN